MCKFWTWRRRRTREWTIGHHNWRMEMLPVFALAGNCYCKVIYYFHKFNVPLFIYLKNSKTYPRIGLFRKLPYPRIRIFPIPIRVSVSVLYPCCIAGEFQLGREGPDPNSWSAAGSVFLNACAQLSACFFHQGHCPNFITSRSNKITELSG